MRESKSGGDAKFAFRIFTVVVVAFLAWKFFIAGSDDTNTATPPPDPIFVPGPVTFAPGLHMLGALSPSVAYVVETSDGLILVDAGLEDSHALLLQQFDVLGLNIMDLRMIILTHGHGDHYLGAMDLKKLTGAKIYAGKGDSDVLRDAGPREAVFSTFPMDHVQIRPTVVDVELTGGETIELGDVQLSAIATPGHTPGSTCYLMNRDGRTALFSGDTIMTMTGDLGTYATYLPPRYRGNAADYLATLKVLESLPVPDLLLPGHPETNERRISAQISADQWSSMLQHGIQTMTELTARLVEDGPDFLDGHAKELVSGAYYLGDYQGTAVYGFAHQSSVVVFDAPGDSGFAEFLKRRLGDIGLDLSMVNAVVLTGIEQETIGGLPTLLEATECQVVSIDDHRQHILQLIPDATVVSSEASPELQEWLPLQAILIQGFGDTRTAWQLEWKGKQFLLTGRIPLKLTEEIFGELRQLKFEPAKWMQSLDRLKGIKPDLWLPARPIHGQMANQYGTDWQDVLRTNRLSLGLGSH